VVAATAVPVMPVMPVMPAMAVAAMPAVVEQETACPEADAAYTEGFKDGQSTCEDARPKVEQVRRVLQYYWQSSYRIDVPWTWKVAPTFQSCLAKFSVSLNEVATSPCTQAMSAHCHV
jgi:hypothetical protein